MKKVLMRRGLAVAAVAVMVIAQGVLVKFG